MFLDFLDDVFLLHFTLEPAQCIFQGLTFLNADFSQLDFTVLPLQVARIALNHTYFERSHIYNYVLAPTSSGPAYRSQALFLQNWDSVSTLLLNGLYGTFVSTC